MEQPAPRCSATLRKPRLLMYPGRAVLSATRNLQTLKTKVIRPRTGSRSIWSIFQRRRPPRRFSATFWLSNTRSIPASKGKSPSRRRSQCRNRRLSICSRRRSGLMARPLSVQATRTRSCRSSRLRLVPTFRSTAHRSHPPSGRLGPSGRAAQIRLCLRNPAHPRADLTAGRDRAGR